MTEKHKVLREIIILAILVALNVVLSKVLAFNLWNMRFGFSFLTLAIAAKYCNFLGPIIVAALGDVLGALLFPTGTFYFGFTITAIISGLIYSIFFSKETKIFNVITTVLSSQLICSLLLNSFWISVLFDTSFTGQLITRLVQVAVMTSIQIVTLYFLFVRFDITKKLKF